jgi:hypothetical protein
MRHTCRDKDRLMRRLARHLFTILSALSLLLCVAVCVLWVQSYLIADNFTYARVWDDGDSWATRWRGAQPYTATTILPASGGAGMIWALRPTRVRGSHLGTGTSGLDFSAIRPAIRWSNRGPSSSRSGCPPPRWRSRHSRGAPSKSATDDAVPPGYAPLAATTSARVQTAAQNAARSPQ